MGRQRTFDLRTCFLLDTISERNFPRGWLLALVLGTLASCRCGTSTTHVESDVRLSATTLDFGQVWVGDLARRSVSLTNTGRASLVVQVATISGPFSTDTALRLGGGGTEALTVVFAPTASGRSESELTLWQDQALAVTLLGEGVTVPTCAPEPCAASAFSFDAGVCVRTVLADDTACADACGGLGACVAGTCRQASSASCDDGNVCTLDACGADAGCVHLEKPVNVADRCQIYRCDPDAGVVSEPAEDGLRCGATTCRSLHFCLTGVCVERPTTNSDDDCRYVDVDQYGTCFVTRSGRLRCFSTLDGGFIGMAFVEGATRVKKAVDNTRWLDLDDALQPSSPFASLGVSAFTEVMATPFGCRAVTTGGSLVDESFGSASVVLDAGVAGLCGLRMARLLDGGIVQRSGAPAPPGAVDCVVPEQFSSETWFLKSNGDLVDRTDALLLQGVTRLSRYSGRVVMRGADVFWQLGDGGFTVRDAWPELPETVSSSGPYLSLCGTTSAGNAWCEGALPGTARSGNPNEPLDLPGGPWDQVDPLRVGTRTWWLGVGQPADGGTGTGRVRHDWGQRTVDQASGDCVLSGNALWCVQPDGGEAQLGNDVVSVEGGCGVTSTGRLLCPGAAPRDGVLPRSTETLWFPRDGGVGTRSLLLPDGGLDLFNPHDVKFPLAGPLFDVSGGYEGGCFAASGLAYCTENGTTPKPMPVRFPVRKLSGGLRHGCAVIGSNRVECWGGDPHFQVLQFSVEVLDIAVRALSAEGGCVLLRGGAVQCFGPNRNGELGVQPQRYGFTRVDQ